MSEADLDRVWGRSESGAAKPPRIHVAANLPVTLQFRNSASLPAETRDIGLGGLSVESASPIPEPVSRVTISVGRAKAEAVVDACWQAVPYHKKGFWSTSDSSKSTAMGMRFSGDSRKNEPEKSPTSSASLETSPVFRWMRPCYPKSRIRRFVSHALIARMPLLGRFPPNVNEDTS